MLRFGAEQEVLVFSCCLILGCLKPLNGWSIVSSGKNGKEFVDKVQTS